MSSIPTPVSRQESLAKRAAIGFVSILALALFLIGVVVKVGERAVQPKTTAPIEASASPTDAKHITLPVQSNRTIQPSTLSGTWVFASELKAWRMVTRRAWTFNPDGSVVCVDFSIQNDLVEKTRKSGAYTISGNRVRARYDGEAREFELGMNDRLASIGDDGRRYPLQKVSSEDVESEMNTQAERAERAGVAHKLGAERGRGAALGFAGESMTPPSVEALDYARRKSFKNQLEETPTLDEKDFTEAYNESFVSTFKTLQGLRAPAF